MAQSVSLWGATYNQVPALDVPKAGGGTARFTDASITTAVESDVASGKVFIKADGSQGTGTASGGGVHVTQDQDGYVVLPKTGGGGGGSSDFSTAEVTVINNTNAPVKVNAPLVIVNGEYKFSDFSTLVEPGTVILNVVLYFGEGTSFVDEGNVSVSGDAELDEGYIIITGDCTITIS